MTMPELDAKQLRMFVNYDKKTGVFTYNTRSDSKTAKKDGTHIAQESRVDSTDRPGIGRLLFVGAHTIDAADAAYLHVTGKFPERRMIHLNGNVFDDRWENLAMGIHKRRSPVKPVYNEDADVGRYSLALNEL